MQLNKGKPCVYGAILRATHLLRARVWHLLPMDYTTQSYPRLSSNAILDCRAITVTYLVIFGYESRVRNARMLTEAGQRGIISVKVYTQSRYTMQPGRACVVKLTIAS